VNTFLTHLFPTDHASPQGCIELLKRYNVPMDGRRAVVLGRSNIVGIPVSQLLLQVRTAAPTPV
jgi:5,10-methylene-tetrahydrofolate dehydrogenase/methenyl tetrahydrofolate cyclohydrolase